MFPLGLKIETGRDIANWGQNARGNPPHIQPPPLFTILGKRSPAQDRSSCAPCQDHRMAGSQRGPAPYLVPGQLRGRHGQAGTQHHQEFRGPDLPPDRRIEGPPGSSEGPYQGLTEEAGGSHPLGLPSPGTSYQEFPGRMEISLYQGRMSGPYPA